MSAPVFPPQPVLMIDDDTGLQQSFAFVLRSQGVNNLAHCSDSRDVERLLAEQPCDVILLDLNMPHISGRDLLPIIMRKHPDVPVIVITGVDDVKTAVQCMREGAFDYMVKPVEEDALISATRRALEVRAVRRENALFKEHLLSAELKHPEAFAPIITASKEMHALFQYIEAVSVTYQPILIMGETGVGKELVARAIHDCSGRKGRFVAVNIAGLDDNVFSDTLFGHLRGAFTGAVDPRKGLIEQAAGGTLFLDEIGELSPASQVKLLRLVQEREYLPLGADNPKYTDARIVVATNQELMELQKQGKFREDLYYRLRSHLVRVPPLRERKGDLFMLVDHFLGAAASEMGKKKPTPPPELFTLLSQYRFPGNIRELEGMIYNAVSTHSTGMLDLKEFKVMIGEDTSPQPRPQDPEPLSRDEAAGLRFDRTMPLPTMRQAEGMMIEEALERTNGNQTLAAKLLGVTRQTLNRYLRAKKAMARAEVEVESV